MNKKISTFIAIALAILLVMGIGGWLYYQQTQPKTSNQVMRVAKYYWPGTYWVEIADKKGWFKEAGLNVQLIDTNADYYKSLSDTAAGKIDTVNFPPFDLVEADAKGADLVTVLVSDFSNGADGIVVKAEIDSIIDLKNKRVAVPTGTYLDYILDVVLSKNGLNPEKDVIKINVSAEAAIAGFIAGQYDAIVNWQPNLSEAATKGNGHVIFDSSQEHGLNFGNWVFKRSFINERPEDVRAFVGVWNKTTNFIKTNPDEAFAIIAEIYKVNPKEVADLALTDKIISLSDNIDFFAFGSGLDSVHGSINKINDYQIGKKIISDKVDSLDIVESTFIRELAE